MMEESQNKIDQQMGSGENSNSRAWVDLVSSIVLIVTSGVIIFWSLKMHRPGGWSSAPGLIPLFLSTCTFFMSLSLLISSIKNRGCPQLITKCRGFSFHQYVSDIKIKRSLWIILLTAFYLFVLLGRIPFELGSCIYLISVFYLFWRKGGWRKIILISILVPFAAGGIFRIIFLIFVPGGSIFDWLIPFFK